jgi:hypothetical protein
MLGRVAMKDVYDVLREKEMEIARLRHEIEALRCAIPLLSDDRHHADVEMSQWEPHAPAAGASGTKFQS